MTFYSKMKPNDSLRRFLKVCRECNHRIFEDRRKNAGQEKRTLLELLNELIRIFQIVNRFRGKKGELDIPEGNIHSWMKIKDWWIIQI